MKKLSKKHIIIIISVAITIIALALVGVLYGIHNEKDKENLKEDDKIESVEDDKTDEDKEEKDTEKDTTSVAEDESEENTSQSEVQTPEVEEPEQQTTQQQGSTNTNSNQNQNNNNNSGGATTPSNSTPTPTPTPEPEKSPYAGMYSPGDVASKERLNKCEEILKGGIASQYIPVRRYENSVSYWGDILMICTNVTDGAWMYINIAGWSGQGIGAETEPIYGEIPSLTKQCLEAIAPQGGTELYNKINSLILQYGNEHNVPSQGTVSESIPGLSVTINDGVNGLEIEFWAE